MQWFKFNWLSIKSKLIVMLLTVSSSSILVTAYLGYQSGKSNLTDRVFNQLTSVRASKAYQIESYFKTISNHIQTLSIDPSVGTALSEFTNAYRQLENVPLPADALPKINAYYQNEFLPKLAQTEQGSPVLNSFLPEAIASNYLQYHYIANNSNPIGKKHLLDKANDSSEYSRLHGRYHPIFRNIIEKFGYYDLFLIDPDGRIVYTVYKETDFASSLTIGAYNESNLARLFASVRRSKEKDYARIIDLESYAPSYGAPAAFIAAPIYNQDKFIGVLAIQVPVDEINNVMTGNRKWEADGLGKSGETYLVGQDYLMRSVSRFLIETPEEYLKTLVALGVNNETIKRIRQYKTSVLAQAVKTTAVEEAMMGKQDIKIIRDYRDIPVLSSYSLLQIEGLKWAILSEIDLAEAYAPIYDFERQLVISATLLMLLVILLAMVMASLFVKPINQLIASARKVAAGQLDAIAVLETEDEFGELAQSFNLMVSSLRDQTDLVEEKNRENEQLLLSIFPAAIAKRLKQGEKNIAESASNVTVLFSDLTGFSKLSDSLTAYEIVSILNDLVTSFDETADRFGMEKIKTIGDSYMAVCGLSVPYLDHDKRAIDFAIEMQAIVRRFSQERGFKLNISLGINSGDIVAGIVGRNKFIYDVWGDTINIASALKSACPEGAILVSREIYNRLCDLYEFAPLATKIEDGEVVLEAWQLKSTIKIKPS
ncbi:adenylate/guanylate cyclase domain-containing protein [Pseudanabaena sp. UWO311]|uniref:adenylate/guanylate cyclase domain-containing protein n=1 Tax=Pseudanabaena sp. UWO311 TaxID=2487337 RepID=UPI00115AC801|nr:adenylate/guanylate cyclase domain-containing protein [Pseudanabaena sp. UWO311]TYQ28034.1 adenylate/guanylate cyclase domain-containing protein [Pseudanabaena sp. UWO311]